MADFLESDRFPLDKHYTSADLRSWDESVRAEIIDGQLYMQAGPDLYHQVVLGNLFFLIKKFLYKKPCKVFAAPLEVRLFPKDDLSDDTYLEPDIFVVCDQSKLDKRGCQGAPDMIIEILSPSTASRDSVRKFNKYLEAGVREYWIVDPDARVVRVNLFENGKYISRAYGLIDPDEPLPKYEQDIVPVTVLPGLEIDLKLVFEEE
jgi:Uma2 family endonuclease